MPALPYHMDCTQPHPLLYPLADGRFQIMQPGTLAPLMIGYGYVLIDAVLAECLAGLELQGITIGDAIIFDPCQRRELTTHKRLYIERHVVMDDFEDLELESEQLFVMDDRHVFVSHALKMHLAAVSNCLSFTEGLEDFAAAGDWTTGPDILAADQLERIRQHLQDVGPIAVQWWHWRGGSAPTALAFDDHEDFLEFLSSKPGIGDAIDVWPFPDDKTPRIAEGKIPNKRSRVPVAGPY